MVFGAQKLYVCGNKWLLICFYNETLRANEHFAVFADLETSVIRRSIKSVCKKLEQKLDDIEAFDSYAL